LQRVQRAGCTRKPRAGLRHHARERRQLRSTPQSLGPPGHGACTGSGAVRARAAPGLRLSPRWRPHVLRAWFTGRRRHRAARVLAVGRGKWPCGPFNITRVVQSCAVRSRSSLGSATAALRSAPFGFAQPALCLAPRPPARAHRASHRVHAKQVSALVASPPARGSSQASRKERNSNGPRPPRGPQPRAKESLARVYVPRPSAPASGGSLKRATRALEQLKQKRFALAGTARAAQNVPLEKIAEQKGDPPSSAHCNR